MVESEYLPGGMNNVINYGIQHALVDVAPSESLSLSLYIYIYNYIYTYIYMSSIDEFDGQWMQVAMTSEAEPGFALGQERWTPSRR